MAGVQSTGTNLDVSLLYDVNGFAVDAPRWFDRAMGWIGEYGILAAMTLLLLGCWWTVRKREDGPTAVAGLIWAPLAAGIAFLVNIPIRGFVKRPRPFVDHQGLEVLASGKHDFSFVSDHSTMAMAIGVGIFVVSRKFGLAGIALAVLEGFCRVYMGVHYPTDVVGGLALGTAVTLLLAPPAMALLTPVTRAVADSRAGWLVRREPEAGEGRPGAGAGTGLSVTDDEQASGRADAPGATEPVEAAEPAAGDKNLAA